VAEQSNEWITPATTAAHPLRPRVLGPAAPITRNRYDISFATHVNTVEFDQELPPHSSFLPTNDLPLEEPVKPATREQHTQTVDSPITAQFNYFHLDTPTTTHQPHDDQMHPPTGSHESCHHETPHVHTYHPPTHPTLDKELKLPPGDVNLPFLLIKFGQKGAKTKQLPILIDTGSNQNFISLELFQSIPCYKSFITGHDEFIVATAKTREKQKVVNCDIPVQFMDKHNNTYTYQLPFRATDIPQGGSYLGCGFTNNPDYIHCMQPTIMNIRHPDRKGRAIALPIHRLSQNKVVLMNSLDITIPAHSMRMVDTYANDTVTSFSDLIIEDIHDDEEEDPEPPYHIYAMKVEKNDFDRYPIAIRNNTALPQSFACNTPLAQIYADRREEILHLNHMTITAPDKSDKDCFFATETCSNHRKGITLQTHNQEKRPTSLTKLEI
jgi:hypothetical protein